MKQHRFLEAETIVDAPSGDVWRAWTTGKEAETFFAPCCAIDARPGGKYEILFDLDQPPGLQGTEGMTVLAVQPETMLSFTWNNPPEMPDLRDQRTHVTLRVEELSPGRTRIALRQDGWGDGAEWDKAYAYFDRAWNRIVLPMLRHRFAHGPVDWDHPPDLSRFQPD